MIIIDIPMQSIGHSISFSTNISIQVQMDSIHNEETRTLQVLVM